MTETRAFAQFAEDWQRITDGWVADLEREMDAAYAADDPNGRYLAAARLRDQVRQAQRVMWATLPAQVRGEIVARGVQRATVAIMGFGAAVAASGEAFRALNDAMLSISE